MKKYLIALLLTGCITSGYARELQETVYLKNGSIIRCSILEMIPGGNLKIQTFDGSIFVYPMTDVERVTKENTQIRNQGIVYKNHYVQAEGNPSDVRRGYRGFAEMGFTFGVGESASSNWFEVSTSHGFQFNPYFYLGGGIAIDKMLGETYCWIPTFVHTRVDFPGKKITPFAELKSGFSVGDMAGGYFSVNIGTRYAISHKIALNASIGYQSQNDLFYDDCYYQGLDCDEYCFDADYMRGISLRIGIEF